MGKSLSCSEQNELKTMLKTRTQRGILFVIDRRAAISWRSSRTDGLKEDIERLEVEREDYEDATGNWSEILREDREQLSNQIAEVN